VPLAFVALACAALIGFAAHRASLCNVRAVAEIMTSGSAHMLWSLSQAVLWMATLTGVMALVYGIAPQASWTRMPLAWSWAGGLLFGAGAAVNGGCSLSTLTRLAGGDLGMAAALAGFLIGVSTWLGVLAMGWPAALTSVASPWLRWPGLAPWALVLLLVWAVHRVWALGKLGAARRLKASLLAPTYHLSVSAALIGLAAGLLYATQDAWSYTNYLRVRVLHAFDAAPAPSAWHGILILGLLGGMCASALHGRSFRWRWPSAFAGWSRHVAGGLLMGSGAAMVPGGNDTLLLGGLPTITGAAFAGYSSMLVGIALVLGALRAAHTPMPAVACSPAGCEEAGAATVAQPVPPDIRQGEAT
jgi:hypothetical protein